MKSRYSGIWWLLVAALVIVIGVAFLDDIEIGDWKVRKAPFREALLAERNTTSGGEDSYLSGGMEEGENGSSHEIQPTDSTAQSLLIIGDSMTLNLAYRLAEYAKHNGHTIHAVNWDSSNTKIWAGCDTLDNFIKRYNVTYVFISLGSNELYIKNPESRRPYVQTILDKVGDLPYIWIGPPNWKEDSGINDMLEATCRPGGFFRSAGMEFERKKDKIHPTRRASALWIDSIMRWMPKSSHPILADLPPDTIGKAPANVTFLKALNK